MSLLWNLLQFALILMFLVLVHEAGHMVVAKWCGMRVERFSIFFGRPIASFTRGETEYAIGWLPLGGYVKITGMTADEDVPPEVEHRAYSGAATWKKIATIAAGPAVNIVVAVLAFTAMFWIGIPTFNSTREVAAITVDSPAQQLGLRPGDEIVAVNGVRSEDVQRLREEITSRPGQEVSVTYTRGEQTFTRRTTTNAVQEGGQTVGRLGLTFDRVPGPTARLGPVDGFTQALDQTWFVVEQSARQLSRVVTSQQAREDVQSIVGVGAVYNEIADDGLWQILQFMGVVSLALAIFNLIPLPPLDGGHILFALIEKVRGTPLPRAAFERASMVGLAVLLVCMVFVVQNDIIDISNGTVLGPR